MGRTASANSGVRAASETTIEITFSYQGKRRRERIKLEPSPANLKRAALHRAAILSAIENGTFEYAVTFPDSKNAKVIATSNPSGVMTVGKWMESYLVRCERRLKSSTLRDYRQVINGLIIPEIGSIALSELRRPDIRQFCESMVCSNKRIANILSVLRSGLQEAVDDELLDVNPIANWTFKRREEVKDDDVDPFTQEEQSAILAQLTGHGHNLLKFAFWTGMRTSELVALEWSDIDFVRGYARVTKALTQAAMDFETPKTRSGKRDVKLLAPALEAISAQKSLSFLHPSGRVFLNPRTGKPWEGDQAIRKTLWHHALKRAGVRYRRPYQTRHTFASMMLSAGESPMWVARQMGHSSWLMIGRVYGKWIPDQADAAGEKAVAAFSGHGVKQMLAKKLAE